MCSNECLIKGSNLKHTRPKALKITLIATLFNSWCSTCSLDSRVKQLNILLDYFTEVIKNTDRLVARLQKQSVDSSLNIEVQYHRYYMYV